MNITWNRIKENYKSIGINFREEMNLLSKPREEDLSEEEKAHYSLLATKALNMLTILGCDIEAFILFARRFLDKVGKLVEFLIKLDSGTYVSNSFSKHRQFFINNPKYNPSYSNYLRLGTNWYEQDLLIWRDGIFVHGKTLNSAPLISLTNGIEFRKVIGVYRFREKDKVKFLRIKKKYENRYPDMIITENPFMMIDEFRREVASRNIILDEEDLRDLKDIISITGTSLDIRSQKALRSMLKKQHHYSTMHKQSYLFPIEPSMLSHLHSRRLTYERLVYLNLFHFLGIQIAPTAGRHKKYRYLRHSLFTLSLLVANLSNLFNS
jgi:hypothetical protein